MNMIMDVGDQLFTRYLRLNHNGANTIMANTRMVLQTRRKLNPRGKPGKIRGRPFSVSSLSGAILIIDRRSQSRTMENFFSKQSNQQPGRRCKNYALLRKMICADTSSLSRSIFFISWTSYPIFSVLGFAGTCSISEPVLEVITASLHSVTRGRFKV